MASSLHEGQGADKGGHTRGIHDNRMDIHDMECTCIVHLVSLSDLTSEAMGEREHGRTC